MQAESLEKVIVALDVENQEKAFQLIDQISPPINFYKVGLELFLKEGKNLVRTLKDKSFKVFLDLKLHDIPNTVSKAIKSIADLEPDFITVHSLGGKEMLAAASSAVKEFTPKTKVLGVTILTSMDQTSIDLLGINSKLDNLIFSLTQNVYDSGCDGIICSPTDLVKLREKFPNPFLIVTPGIRSENDDAGDQKRVETAKRAIENGSNFIVVGRLITTNSNPKKAIYQLF